MKRIALPIKDRFLSELILCGGEVLTRGEACVDMQREGVPRAAIDWWYGVPALTEEELLQLARAGLVLTLRLRCQRLFTERNEHGEKEQTRSLAKDH